jgi:DinB superfamily
MMRPGPDEYASFYKDYVGLVEGDDAMAALRSVMSEILDILRNVSDDEAMARRPPYVWSIKQVVGHLIDCERIQAYRILRIARGDATPLPGFEENDYFLASGSDARSLGDLVAEYEVVRRSTLALLAGLPEEAWARRGVANNCPVSARALAFIIAGHERHHAIILRKRLGVASG